MFRVEMTSIPAASSSSTSCAALLVARTGTLVCASSSTSATAGRAGEDRVDVHLFERRTSVLEPRGARRLFEFADLFRGAGPAVGLDEPDDDVGAPSRAVADPR